MNFLAIPSLRWRLVAVMCLAYIVVAGATEIVGYSMQRGNLRHALETSARSDAVILAAGALAPLRRNAYGDIVTLNRFVQSIEHAKSVVNAGIYGSEGCIIVPAHTTLQRCLSPGTDPFSHAVLILPHGDVEARAPIADQATPLGVAAVRLSSSAVESDVQSTLFADLLLRGIGLIVFVFLTLATAQYILGPLSGLARAARSIRHGEMSARVPETGQTELATVAAAFNDMAAALEQRIGHLSFLSTAAPVLPSAFRDKGDISPTLEQFCQQVGALGVGLLPRSQSDQDPVWYDPNPEDQGWRVGAAVACERVIGPTATVGHNRAFFAVPVLGDTVFVTAREGKRPFSQEEQQVITNFAYQLGVAADNAHLFESQQEALQVKDQFLSIVSHELRTPLTTIKGYAQILRSRLDDTRDERRFAVNIDAQVSRLSRLVDDLLDVTRFTRGEFELKRQPVELNALLEDVVARFRIVAPNHTIALSLEQGTYEGFWDRDRLEQVMNNLVGNAVKYSPAGETVSIRTSHTADDVMISVRDEGEGIPVEDQEKLFERFFRGTAEGSQITGLGLGLYVTRRIVEAHGGTIMVSSRQGEGSEFSFRLPLTHPAAVPTGSAS